MALIVSKIDNNAGISYNQYGTDRQKTRMNKFINKDDADIAKMAVKNYNKKHLAEDKKFAKNVSTTINSVPLLAVASGLALKKGLKPSVMDGVSWGMALLAPAVVSTVNNKLVNKSQKIKKAEEKHPTTAYLTGLAASVGTFFGLDALAKRAMTSPKLGANPKVKSFAKNIESGVKDIYNNVAKNIKMPKAVKNLADKVKVPEFAKKGIETVKNSNITKGLVNAGKNVGKFALRNAPMLAVLGVFTALVGKTVQQSKEFSKEKTQIKEAQLNSARVLVDAYARENESLKTALNMATSN